MLQCFTAATSIEAGEFYAYETSIMNGKGIVIDNLFYDIAPTTYSGNERLVLRKDFYEWDSSYNAVTKQNTNILSSAAFLLTAQDLKLEYSPNGVSGPAFGLYNETSADTDNVKVTTVVNPSAEGFYGEMTQNFKFYTSQGTYFESFRLFFNVNFFSDPIPASN